MTLIKHTRERESHLRFGGLDGIEFPAGERVIDVDDDHAEWAVENFGDIEYANEDGSAEETVESEETEAEDEDGDENE